MSIQVAVDTGGTFTDLVWRTAEGISSAKVLTTYPDPSVGVLAAIREALSSDLSNVDTIVHATTLASNTVIQRTGTGTALVTTRGFRDVLLIGRQKRYDVFDLNIEKPKPLVCRRWIFEVSERVTSDGAVLLPLDEVGLLEIAEQLVARGIKSIALAFLNSYVNPSHEQLAAQVIKQRFPHVSVSISSEIAPQWREYERTNTTVLNAYLSPVMSKYLHELQRKLREAGFAGDLLVMHSSGGITSADVAAQFPVRMLESGPAAGVLMAKSVADRLGQPNVVSFDMGGTTAKMGLVQDGQPALSETFEIGRVNLIPRSGLPVMIPSVELIEIGAGGGSIATTKLGVIAVGPQSAGADPGPACYGRGGEMPTVTDANLILGYLDPAYFVGGQFSLDVDAARTAIDQHIAAPLSLSMVDAAWAIHHVVNLQMAGGARAASIARGVDVRSYPLLAFGGAGPVHAARIAEDLGVRSVIVPPRAGVGTATGLLDTDVRFDLSRTVPLRIDAHESARVGTIYRELEATAENYVSIGSNRGAVSRVREVDLRYVGQGFEIRCPVPDMEIGPELMCALGSDFHEHYRRVYGTSNAQLPVEATNWHLSVIARGQRQGQDNVSAPVPPVGGEAPVYRPAYFSESGGYLDCPVYRRGQLNSEVGGPAIVQDPDCTIVVPPTWSVRLDGLDNLALTRKDGHVEPA